MNKTPTVERRLFTRHRAKTRVKIIYRTGTTTRSLFTHAVNLSANGVFLKTDGFNLTRGKTVELVFVISFGVVQKLHRRVAKVIHVTNGGTGFLMESAAKV